MIKEVTKNVTQTMSQPARLKDFWPIIVTVVGAAIVVGGAQVQINHMDATLQDFRSVPATLSKIETILDTHLENGHMNELGYIYDLQRDVAVIEQRYDEILRRLDRLAQNEHYP